LCRADEVGQHQIVATEERLGVVGSKCSTAIVRTLLNYQMDDYDSQKVDHSPRTKHE
jgi:hypothetical protein